MAHRFLRSPIWALLLFLPLPGWTNAQILNAELFQANEIQHEDQPVAGNVQLNASLVKQQSVVYQLQGQSDVSILTGSQWRTILAGQFTYNGSSGEELLNSGYLHVRLRQGPERPQTPEAFVQYQWDGVRGLRNRFLSGVNQRFRLLRDSLNQLTTGAGLMYEHEVWTLEGVPESRQEALDDPTQVRDLIKLNVYLRYQRQWLPKLRFAAIGYFQARPDSWIRYPRVAYNQRLQLSLGNGFSYQLLLDAIYDLRPIVPIDRFYYSLQNGLRWGF